MLLFKTCDIKMLLKIGILCLYTHSMITARWYRSHKINFMSLWLNAYTLPLSLLPFSPLFYIVLCLRSLKIVFRNQNYLRDKLIQMWFLCEIYMLYKWDSLKNMLKFTYELSKLKTIIFRLHGVDILWINFIQLCFEMMLSAYFEGPKMKHFSETHHCSYRK